MIAYLMTPSHFVIFLKRDMLKISSGLDVILGYFGFINFSVLELSGIIFTEFGVLDFFGIVIILCLGHVGD